MSLYVVYEEDVDLEISEIAFVLQLDAFFRAIK